MNKILDISIGEAFFIFEFGQRTGIVWSVRSAVGTADIPNKEQFKEKKGGPKVL